MVKHIILWQIRDGEDKDTVRKNAKAAIFFILLLNENVEKLSQNSCFDAFIRRCVGAGKRLDAENGTVRILRM